MEYSQHRDHHRQNQDAVGQPAAEGTDTDGHTADGSGNSGDATVVCLLCLGIMQSLDGRGSGLTATQCRGGPAVALPDRGAGGGSWLLASDSSPAGIARTISVEGHDPSAVAPKLSLPPGVLLRQAATLQALRSLLPHAPWLSPAQAINLPGVKMAKRHALTPLLAAELGYEVQSSAEVTVAVMWVHPGSNEEVGFLFPGSGNQGKRHKRRRGERNVTNLASIGRTGAIGTQVAALGPGQLKQACGVPPLPPTHCAQAAVRVARGAVYVGGRYRKLARDISQFPRLQGKAVTSVEEELVRHLLPGLRCDSHNLKSAGREDCDVRMLGRGRPFVLEVINARAAMPDAVYFQAAEDALTASGCGVEAEGVCAADKGDYAALKLGDATQRTSYSALCRLSAEPTLQQLADVSSMKELQLAQHTPRRVLWQRAADSVRPRLVHDLKCIAVPGTKHHVVLELTTQGGTHIKQFVDYDNGRTVPSLGTLLGCSAEMLQLDVTDVDTDF